MTDELTPAEVATVTGKKRAAAQAAELARRGIAFTFTGQGVKVKRAVAMAYDILPERAHTGVNLAAVR